MNVTCPEGYTCKLEPYDAVSMHLFVIGIFVVILAIIIGVALVELKDRR